MHFWVGGVTWLIYQGLGLPIPAIFLAIGGAALGALVAAVADLEGPENSWFQL